MKWRNSYGKKLDESKAMVGGEKKIARKFAIFPVRVSGNTIWLQFYYCYYEWLPYTKVWCEMHRSL